MTEQKLNVLEEVEKQYEESKNEESPRWGKIDRKYGGWYWDENDMEACNEYNIDYPDDPFELAYDYHLTQTYNSYWLGNGFELDERYYSILYENHWGEDYRREYDMNEPATVADEMFWDCYHEYYKYSDD